VHPPVTSSFSVSDGQATLLRRAETGIGTTLSLTVILIVSDSEQYLTLDTVTPLGKQSVESLNVTSCPDLVKVLPEHAKPMIPSPAKSKEPALSAKSLMVTVTISVRPSAPPAP